MKHTSFREESGMIEEKPEPKCIFTTGSKQCLACPDYKVGWKTWIQGETPTKSMLCMKKLRAKWK